MIAYDRYTEYLSKQIYKTITPTVPSLFQVPSFSISDFPMLAIRLVPAMLDRAFKGE